jgi:hypothetical protein
MQNSSRSAAFVLGGLISLGLVFLGYFIGSAAIEVKEYERTVKVKGLSEREYPADIVIWPIVFSVAANNLDELYVTVERNNRQIQEFLSTQGIAEDAVTIALPAITDKSAQQYGGSAPAPFRYTARQTVTVYTQALEKARAAMSSLSVLGKKGIVFEGDGYGNQTEYLFTRLNEIKPEMIEEATRKAREVALKFAEDSQSSLGKIKRASQGQFSISARDTNNPHVKRIRVVSTVEYYLSD